MNLFCDKTFGIMSLMSTAKSGVVNTPDLDVHVWDDYLLIAAKTGNIDIVRYIVDVVVTLMLWRILRLYLNKKIKKTKKTNKEQKKLKQKKVERNNTLIYSIIPFTM